MTKHFVYKSTNLACIFYTSCLDGAVLLIAIVNMSNCENQAENTIQEIASALAKTADQAKFIVLDLKNYCFYPEYSAMSKIIGEQIIAALPNKIFKILLPSHIFYDLTTAQDLCNWLKTIRDYTTVEYIEYDDLRHLLGFIRGYNDNFTLLMDALEKFQLLKDITIPPLSPQYESESQLSQAFVRNMPTQCESLTYYYPGICFNNALINSTFFSKLKNLQHVHLINSVSDYQPAPQVNTTNDYLLPFFNKLPESIVSLALDDAKLLEFLANAAQSDEREKFYDTLSTFKLKKLSINCGNIMDETATHALQNLLAHINNSIVSLSLHLGTTTQDYYIRGNHFSLAYIKSICHFLTNCNNLTHLNLTALVWNRLAPDAKTYLVATLAHHKKISALTLELGEAKLEADHEPVFSRELATNLTADALCELEAVQSIKNLILLNTIKGLVAAKLDIPEPAPIFWYNPNPTCFIHQSDICIYRNVTFSIYGNIDTGKINLRNLAVTCKGLFIKLQLGLLGINQLHFRLEDNRINANPAPAEYFFNHIKHFQQIVAFLCPMLECTDEMKPSSQRYLTCK